MWTEYREHSPQRRNLKITKPHNENFEIDLNEEGELLLETKDSARRLRNTINNRSDEVINHLEKQDRLLTFIYKVQEQCLHLINWVEKDHKTTNRNHEEYKEEIRELKEKLHQNTCTQEQLIEKIELLELQITTSKSTEER